MESVLFLLANYDGYRIGFHPSIKEAGKPKNQKLTEPCQSAKRLLMSQFNLSG